MPILALDVGEKKIGVAISRSGLLAEELRTIRTASKEIALGELIFLINAEKIEVVVIGLPKRLDGTIGKMENLINYLAKKLSSYTKIVFEDETLSTKEAERILFGYGLSVEQVRDRRDQMAAKLILDQYLDNL